ncbi:MAG: hypothetical protein RIA65_05560 [Woeseia sp.]
MHRTLQTFVSLCLLMASVTQAELGDPTRPSYVLPASDGAVASAVLRVSAVFISGDRRIAVINGQRLRVGESVGGATISEIESNQVSFVRGDRTFSVPLLSAQSRQ